MSLLTPIARTLRFKIAQQRRAVVQLQIMIAEFDRQADSLDREVRIEEDRANNHGPSHFAYPPYAKAATQRRNNLRRSSNELEGQLAAAKNALAETTRLLDATQPVEMHVTSTTRGSSKLNCDQHSAAL